MDALCRRMGMSLFRKTSWEGKWARNALWKEILTCRQGGRDESHSMKTIVHEKPAGKGSGARSIVGRNSRRQGGHSMLWEGIVHGQPAENRGGCSAVGRGMEPVCREGRLSSQRQACIFQLARRAGCCFVMHRCCGAQRLEWQAAPARCSATESWL